VADDIKFAKEDENDDRVKAFDFIYPKGTHVWVKVTQVQPDERGDVRVNGSMRAVSQADGSDLDPAGRMLAGGWGCGLVCGSELRLRPESCGWAKTCSIAKTCSWDRGSVSSMKLPASYA
jgi:hypothetical protein